MLFFFSLFCVLFANPAQAYIDPGTGSFLLQIMVGTVLSGVVALKLFWNELKLKMRRLVKLKSGHRPDSQDKHSPDHLP